MVWVMRDPLVRAGEGEEPCSESQARALAIVACVSCICAMTEESCWWDMARSARICCQLGVNPDMAGEGVRGGSLKGGTGDFRWRSYDGRSPNHINGSLLEGGI